MASGSLSLSLSLSLSHLPPTPTPHVVSLCRCWWDVGDELLTRLTVASFYRELHASSLLLRSRAHRSRQPPPAYTTTATGLQYLDEVVGDGDTPQSGSKVTVHYTGSLADGKV